MTSPTTTPHPATEQWFLAPPSLPFLEIRTTLHSVQPYAEHFHLGFSLGVILAGQTRFYLGAQPHCAAQGDIVLIPPGYAHRCNPMDNQPRSYHMLIIDAGWLTRRVWQPLGLAAHGRPCRPLVASPECCARIAALVAAINDDSHNPAHEQSLADILIALHEATRCFAPMDDSQHPTDVLSATKRLGIADMMAEGASPVHLMARRAGLRRESLARQLWQKTSLSPLAIVHCFRIERAKLLLRRGASLAEAALATGYADQSHFHRMFVKYCSVTPGRYLRRRSHLYKK